MSIKCGLLLDKQLYASRYHSTKSIQLMWIWHDSYGKYQKLGHITQNALACDEVFVEYTFEIFQIIIFFPSQMRINTREFFSINIWMPLFIRLFVLLRSCGADACEENIVFTLISLITLNEKPNQLKDRKKCWISFDTSATWGVLINRVRKRHYSLKF